MPTSPRTQREHQLAQEKLAERAIQLYACGHSYRRVAQLLSDPSGLQPPVNYSWVKRRVDGHLKGLADSQRATVEEWRDRELAKMVALEHAIADQVAAGSLKAVTVSLRISQRRARLLGLDAPEQLDVTVTQTPPAVVDLVTQARERMSAGAAN